MSSRFPDYEVLGGYAPNSTVLAALSVFRINVFGQTRYCWWLNRAVTVTEASWLRTATISAVYESMVVGSTKAGVEISHPRLRAVPAGSIGCSRACNNRMVISQVDSAGVRAYVALQYSVTAPPALQLKYLTPPFAHAGLPVVLLVNQCALSGP